MTDNTDNASSPQVELKPCPFCGGEASVYYHYHGFEVTWSARCKKCSAEMAYVALTKAKAIAAWNTRAADKWRYIESARAEQ